MQTNKELITRLRAGEVLHTPRIIEAFERIKRSDFVPDELRPNAYADEALPIGHGQTISQPTTVALMLELLEPQEGHKILDIGSGSGWTTALLADIAGASGEARGVERIPELVERAKRNVAAFGLENIHFKWAGSQLGLPDDAPFDRILCSAAAKRFPEELTEQLADGGILIIPVDDTLWKVELLDGKPRIERHHGFTFVPLVY